MSRTFALRKATVCGGNDHARKEIPRAGHRLSQRPDTHSVREEGEGRSRTDTKLLQTSRGALVELEYAFSIGADLFLRIQPTPTTVHQGDRITYTFSMWNLGPDNADHEVLDTQVPAGTTFDYIRISGTPGLGTCTTPPYQGTGQIICHENGSMAPNTTWTVRLIVKVTAPAGTVIFAGAATMADTPDPNLANNMATVSITVK